MKFIFQEKKGDVTKFNERLPLLQMNIFINKLNKVLAAERSKAKRMMMVILCLILLIVYNVIMAVFDKTLFFYVLTFILLLPTLFFLCLLTKVYKRLLPKVERYIEQYNPTYEPFGIEWYVKHTVGYPNWIELQLKSNDRSSVTIGDANTSSIPICTTDINVTTEAMATPELNIPCYDTFQTQTQNDEFIQTLSGQSSPIKIAHNEQDHEIEA